MAKYQYFSSNYYVFTQDDLFAHLRQSVYLVERRLPSELMNRGSVSSSAASAGTKKKKKKNLPDETKSGQSAAILEARYAGSR